MRFIHWIYIFSLYTAKLILSIESTNSYYNISNIKIQSIIYNGTTTLFCSNDNDDACVKQIKINFNLKSITFNDISDVRELSLETDGQLELSYLAIYRSNVTDTHISMTKKQSVDYNTTILSLEFSQNTIVITLSLIVTCTNGYLQPSCSEVDICKKVPENICRNNGSCVSKMGSIECRCRHGYRGEFCDELANPCLENFCSIHSTCLPDNSMRLKYRCLCKDGYYGVFCRQLTDPCMDNFCVNNSTCIVNKEEKIGYHCQCTDGYTGQFCAQTINNCAANNSLCSQYINATCINIVRGHLCYCDGGCKMVNDVTSTPDKMSLPFKWPFSDLITFLLVVLEAIVIVTLIILIIFMAAGCCRPNEKRDRSYYDDHFMTENKDIKLTRTKELEFSCNYKRQKPIDLNDIDNNHSINPLYEANDLQSFSNNQLLLDNTGMSTFGRR